MSRLHWVARWTLFVGLIVLMVGIYCYLGARALPPLRSEPPSFLIIPMMVISGTVSLFLFPALCATGQRSSRILLLYGGFLAILVVYGIYLWAAVPDGTPWMILLALLAGHLYGFPLFFAILGTQLFLTYPLLAPIHTVQRARAE